MVYLFYIEGFRELYCLERLAYERKYVQEKNVKGCYFMKLFVVRHGETDFNVMGRYAGSTDIPLNETGISQAENLSRKLKEEDVRFDVVISSPLLRARQTAEIVCSAIGLPFNVVDQFAERDVGVFEGLTQEEAEREYPEEFKSRCTRTVDYAPPNGETIRQFDKRVTDGIKYLCCHYPDKNVLLICHGFTARAINRYCKGLSFEDMHDFVFGNCEVAEYLL